jgi:nicotinamide-nucleotide amidase
MDELVIKLFDCLSKKQWTIATAESCTGGMIAQVITDVSGSSAYFDRGFVTYSNEAKITMLDVQPLTIEKFGAVSEQTARLMARGAYAHSNANIAVSVTGIAGPGGGSVDKPVGLVFIAIATEDFAKVFKHHFEGDRKSIRLQTTVAAIEHIIDYCVAP